MPPLPSILEIKRTLSGREKQFDCRVLAARDGYVIVLFVAAETMHVHGVDLPAGTVTFGHFWEGRPYNVYHWLDAATGRTLGCYVNLSRDTVIREDRLEWLDLVVDVLVVPGEEPRVLDEDEVPADASLQEREAIAYALVTVRAVLPALLRDLETERERLWPVALAERTGP
ncbi:MAG TPA: DUF402 domain-containing protein [Polyangia bacterium]|nr:DUF402 domain-containing protein [Polyangia bacterium]